MAFAAHLVATARHTTWVAVVLLAVAACGGGLQPLPPVAAPAPVVAPPSVAAGPAASSDDAALAARRLMVPVDAVSPERLADNYAASRGERVHGALDILAPRGTPVVAADGGKVWKVRSNTLGGLTIYTIDDEQRFVYYYAHLDRYAEGLHEGQQVAQGDLLGYVGTTGNAPPDVPHLHFQVMRYRGDGRWWDGEPLNPFPYFTRQGKVNEP